MARRKTNEKPIVFLSHIHEEKEIAIALKKVIEKGFLNMMDVFVSSDPTSIEMGRRWLDDVRGNLKHCAVEILILSPEALKRQWIHFEAGAGWIRHEIPVVPICHSGISPEQLPIPLNLLQGGTATEREQLKNLLPILAKALGCAVPEVDFSEFIATVTTYEGLTQQSEAIKPRSSLPSPDCLPSHELATLIAVTEDRHGPQMAASIASVYQALSPKLREFAIAIALKMLDRKGYIELGKDV